MASGKATPQPANQPQLRIGDYLLGETVGKGSFGKVKKGTHVPTGQTVAIKIQNRLMLTSSNMDKKIRREIKILKLFCHPNVCRLYDVIYTTTDIFAVMEYVDGPELYTHIVNNGKLREADARYIFQQVVCAVEYCHHYRVVHRDLKPENILLGSNQTVKLIDFGLANIMQDGTCLRTSCGSPNYAAPEVISGRLYVGPEIDVWSCGVVLYALLCGCLPFDEETIPQLFAKIKKGQYNIPSHLSPEAVDLLRQLLTVDPLARITIPQLRDHPWFVRALPKYLVWRPALFAEHAITVDEYIVRRVMDLSRSTFDAVSQAVVRAQVPTHGGCEPLAVVYNILADAKRKKEIEDMERNNDAETSSNTSRSAAQQHYTASQRELNQGLVLSAPPAIASLLDHADGATAATKDSYNNSRFLPASVQATLRTTSGGMQCSPGPGAFHITGDPSSFPGKIGSLRASVSERVGSVGRTGSGLLMPQTMSASLSSAANGSSSEGVNGANRPAVLVGSVAKTQTVYDSHEEAVAFTSMAGWRVGLMTDLKSSALTNEIYVALRELAMEWRVVSQFVIAARPMNKSSSKGGVEVQLHVLRLKEKHEKGYIVDFSISKGHVILAVEAILAIVKKLQMRIA